MKPTIAPGSHQAHPTPPRPGSMPANRSPIDIPSVPAAVHQAVREEVATARRSGREPDWAALRAAFGASVSLVATMAKADLFERFSMGETPAAAEYLKRFPELRGDSDRVLSLVYEEFCLLEETGAAPDPSRFCERYEPWSDSLRSQLEYHRVLSRAVGLPMPPLPFPEPGELFGKFELRSVLGNGGSARVFLAVEPDLGHRKVALKVSADRGEEASIMGNLHHRRIISVNSLVRQDETGLLGLCMPYTPGRPLDQVLGRMEKLATGSRSATTILDAAQPDDLSLRPGDGDGWAGFPRNGSYVDACVWVAAALADALSHAHSQGILHRDVKPANVLISATDGPQLLDFNLAHDPSAPERAESALRGGTLPYMAPEQLHAFLDSERWGDVGPAADQYALGLVLVELLTGRRPEAPGPDVPLTRAINELLDQRSERYPAARPWNPSVPFALQAILDRCLDPDPASRYPDVAALADDLRLVLERRDPRLVRNPSGRERARFWLRRHRSALVGLALALSLAAGLGAYAYATRETAADASEHVTVGSMYDLKASQEIFTDEDRREFRSQAVREYRRALELDPGNFRAYHGLALNNRAGAWKGWKPSPEYWGYIDRAIELADEAMGSTGTDSPRAYLTRLHIERASGYLRESMIDDAGDGPNRDPENRQNGHPVDPRMLAMASDDLDAAMRYRSDAGPEDRVMVDIFGALISILEASAYPDGPERRRLRERAAECYRRAIESQEPPGGGGTRIDENEYMRLTGMDYQGNRELLDNLGPLIVAE